MARTLQFRRATTAEISSITGAEGELFVDLDKNVVVVMDGSTEGGYTLQPELLSGTNIKTVNGVSILGAGDVDLSTNLTLNGTNLEYTDIDGNVDTIDLSGFLDDTTNTIVSGTLNGNTITFTREDATTFDVDVTALYDDTNLVTSVNGDTGAITVQETLVSGTNIKTINNESILGSGNIEISSDADLSEVAEDVLPLFDGVFDLGGTDKRWFDVFVENSVDIAGATITGSEDGIVIPDAMLVGELLFTDNIITPDIPSDGEYLGDTGTVIVNGNIDVSGDILQNGSQLELGPIEEGDGSFSVVAYPDQGNTASGNNSTVGGGGFNTASGSASTVAGGDNNTASGSRSTVGGGYINTVSCFFSTVGGGYINTASDFSSTVGGGCNNTASGSASTVGGGSDNTASDFCSTVAGGDNNTASCYCSTVGGGGDNTASNSNSTVAGGDNNTASCFFSTVGGGNANTASGHNSTVVGGEHGCAYQYGQRSYASGSFATAGDAQQVDYVARAVTTSSSSVNLTLDGFGNGDEISVPTDRTLFATVNVAGIKSDGSTAAHYIRKVAVKNVSGTVSLIDDTTIGTDFEDDAAYDVIISANNTDKELRIQVAGKDSETLRWVSHIQGVEIAMGS